MTEKPQCFYCVHRMQDMKCSAFYGRIPASIWLNEHDHRKPYKGDGGVRFKPIGGKD